MINTFFANKSNMTGMYTADGRRVGVTFLKVPATKVKELRTLEKNGYCAVRLAISGPRGKQITREVRSDEVIEAETEIKFDEIVKPGDFVDVSGISKGKGFAGVVKRHGFKGGPRTHGQSDRERAPGSSGSTTTPGRVYRGTRRAGHMGNKKISVRKLEVLQVDPDNNRLAVIGSIPGFAGNNNLLTVRRAE